MYYIFHLLQLLHIFPDIKFFFLDNLIYNLLSSLTKNTIFLLPLSLKWSDFEETSNYIDSKHQCIMNLVTFSKQASSAAIPRLLMIWCVWGVASLSFWGKAVCLCASRVPEELINSECLYVDNIVVRLMPLGHFDLWRKALVVIDSVSVATLGR